MKWFKRRKKALATQPDEKSDTEYVILPKQGGMADDTWIFQAHLNISTPLNILRMHGQSLQSHDAPEPRHSEYGHWVQFADSIFNSDDPHVKTDAGNVPSTWYLNYMLEIRTLLMGEYSLFEKMHRIENVAKDNPNYQLIEQRLLANYKVSDIMVLISRFLSSDDQLRCCIDKPGALVMINGINAGVVNELAHQGIYTIADILPMTGEQLLAVRGLYITQVDRIVAHQQYIQNLLEKSP